MTLTMYDSIQVSQIPAQAAYIAGYVDGNWRTFPVLQRAFPHAKLLSITVTAGTNADCLDVETGDATIAQAPAWVRRQLARGLYRPVVYAQASNMGALLHALEAAGTARASVRLWAAHYGEGAHICGPSTCRYPGIPACDGTQWTPAALGRDLDESRLLADFFDPRPAPKPRPAPTEDDDMPAPFLLSGGAGSVTPVAFAGKPAATKIRFFPGAQSGQEVSVAFNGHPAQAVKLGNSALAVDIPQGALGCRVTRVDGGTEDVSAVVE